MEINPNALFKYRIGLEDVRAALASANAHSPKGAIEDGDRRYQLYTNDQAMKAEDYRPLIIAYRDGAPVHLTDVAEVVDSVENLRNQGLANGKPAVLVILYRQPGANIIDTVERVKALLPQLQASIPSAINVQLTMDRTTTIRASLHDVERALMIAITLVILVVFLFLRNARATLIPSVAVPVSLIGTFGAMYLLGYSLDNLSLMALTISTGFVVDDAIVVLENITRHMEAGMPRMEAALRGAGEVSFTVLSMSLSLIAVFVPILLMGGIVGRLFREFAMTLSIAILISLVVSLTTTPMMCAHLLVHRPASEHGRFYRWGERAFDWVLDHYDRSLRACAAPSVPGAVEPAGDDRPRNPSFRDHPEGLFPPAGHRAHGRRHPGRSEHFVSGDGEKARPVRRHHPRRSGGRQRRRLYRRRPDQFRLCLCRAEAAQRARAVGRSGDRPAAAQARPGRRRAAVLARGAGRLGRRPAE